MKRALLVVLCLAACLPDLPDLSGKSCDADHPCGDGYSCLGGFCCAGSCQQPFDDAGTGDAGTIDAGMIDAGFTDAGSIDAGPSRGPNLLPDPGFESPDASIRWQAISGTFDGGFRKVSPGHESATALEGSLTALGPSWIMQLHFDHWQRRGPGTYCATAFVRSNEGSAYLNVRFCTPATDGGICSDAFDDVNSVHIAHDGGWQQLKVTYEADSQRLFFPVVLGQTLVTQQVDDVDLFESFSGSCP